MDLKTEYVSSMLKKKQVGLHSVYNLLYDHLAVSLRFSLDEKCELLYQLYPSK